MQWSENEDIKITRQEITEELKKKAFIKHIQYLGFDDYKLYSKLFDFGCHFDRQPSTVDFYQIKIDLNI